MNRCLVGLFGNEAELDPSKWKLFDLQNDPGEMKSLTKQHPEKVAELRTEFVRWFNDVTDGVTYAPIPIPVASSFMAVRTLSEMLLSQ